MRRDSLVSENPQGFQCPHCHASITQGQTYCSNCKTHIAWHSGQPRESVPQTIQRVVAAALWLIFLIIFFRACASCSPSPNSATAPTTSPAVVKPQTRKMSVEVTEAKYEYGYLTVTAIATNIGDVAIYSPSLKCIVMDEAGKVKLGEDTAWPAGTIMEDFGVGESSAADFFVLVSGEPNSIKWRIEGVDIDVEVKYPN